MKEIYLSTTDYHRLQHLLRGLTSRSESIARLRGEIARAALFDPAIIPAGVVGLNCRVQLKDLDTGDCEEYMLTMPSESDPDNQRISVLAPIGTALLGFREGDEIEWPTPGGIRRLKLLRVMKEKTGSRLPSEARTLLRLE